MGRDRSATRTFGAGPGGTRDGQEAAKYGIAMGALTASGEAAGICRKRGPSPSMCCPRMEKFPKAAKAGKSNTAAAKALQMENGRLKTPLAESAPAVGALKNPGGEEAPGAVPRLAHQGMPLNGALLICEASKQRRRWKKKARGPGRIRPGCGSGHALGRVLL